MTYPPYIREKARTMRTERRMTIDEIAERLAVSRGSVYGWVRDLPFDAKTPARSAAQRRAAGANSERARSKRRSAYVDGAREYAWRIRDPTFRDFLCLYVAEGYKRNRNVVSIANSDGRVLQVAVRWMRELTDKRLTYSIQYHADQDLAEITTWWGAQLDIAPDVIELQRKSNSNQLSGRTWRSVHGVMSVRARHDVSGATPGVARSAAR